jgi:imidazolonepropionase-like amidohydrolase
LRILKVISYYNLTFNESFTVMKHPKLLLLSLFVIVITTCQSPEFDFAGAVVIQNITTIDAVNGANENRDVVIRDGKIIKVGETEDLSGVENVELMDGTGKYLIPGLWDTHVHFSFIEELTPAMFDLFLIYGITSVRDTGAEIGYVKEWQNRALANPLEAPRVMIAGPLLDGMPNVYDGSSPGRPLLSEGFSTVEEITEGIYRLDSIGVDLLKAYEMLTPEQFEEVTRLGRELGLKVTGHVPLSMDVISASNAGMNSMEHLRNLELSSASNADELLEERRQMLIDGKDDEGGVLRSRIHSAQRERAIQNYDDQKNDEILAVLARNETWQIPTLALNLGATEQHFTEPEWIETFRYLPQSVEANWRESAEGRSDSEITPFRAQQSEWLLNMAGKIHRAGVEIMAGTDTPIGLLTPGKSLHRELRLLVEAGLTPLEALKTATLNPARYFGLEDELGSIEEGMWADLIILDSNPMDDIRNTKEIHTVIRQGNVLDPTRLDQIRERLINQ